MGEVFAYALALGVGAGRATGFGHVEIKPLAEGAARETRVKTYKYTVEQHWYRMRREVSPEPRDEHHWALADAQHFYGIIK